MQARIYDLNAESIKGRSKTFTDDKFTFLGPRARPQSAGARPSSAGARPQSAGARPKTPNARPSSATPATRKQSADAKRLRDEAARLQSLAAQTENQSKTGTQPNKPNGKAPRDLKPPSVYRDATSGREYLQKVLFDRPQLRPPPKNIQFEQSEIHLRPALFTPVKIQLGKEGEKTMTSAYSRLFAAHRLGVIVMCKCIAILRKYGVTQNRIWMYNSLFHFSDHVANAKENKRSRTENQGTLEKTTNGGGYDASKGIDDVVKLIKREMLLKCKDQLKKATQISTAASLKEGDLSFNARSLGALWTQQETDLMTEMIFDARTSSDIANELYKFIEAGKINESTNLNTYWANSDNQKIASTVHDLLKLHTLTNEDSKPAKDFAVFKMMKELILNESVRLHNKALSHIMALCENIHHPDIGHRLCIIYKNSIMKVINSNANEMHGPEVPTLMNAIGAVYDAVEIDKRGKGEFSRNDNLLSALATTQNDDGDAVFKVTLYRALGFKHTGDVKKLQPYLLNQLHTALILEGAHTFSRDIPNQQLIAIPSDNSKIELGSVSESLLKAVKNVPNVVNIRKIFYKTFLQNAGAITRSSANQGSKDIVLLMNSSDIKENVRQLVKFIPDIPDRDGKFHMSNALGITAVPLVSGPTVWAGPVDPSTTDTVISMTEKAHKSKTKIEKIRIESNKLSKEIQTTDVESAANLLKYYKEQEENAKRVNYFWLWKYGAEYESRQKQDTQKPPLGNGWLRSDVIGKTFGVTATDQPEYVSHVPMQENGIELPVIDYKSISRGLCAFNTTTDGTPVNATTPVVDLVVNIFRSRFESEYSWILKRYAKKFMPNTMSRLGSQDEPKTSHFDPVQVGRGSGALSSNGAPPGTRSSAMAVDPAPAIAAPSGASSAADGDDEEILLEGGDGGEAVMEGSDAK